MCGTPHCLVVMHSATVTVRQRKVRPGWLLEQGGVLAHIQLNGVEATETKLWQLAALAGNISSEGATRLHPGRVSQVVSAQRKLP